MHRGHSVEQTGTICSLSEHETSRALGDTVHQDPPAAGRRCTRSSISRCRSSAEACRASIARCLCSATAARRSVAIFPPCALTALQPFGRPRSRGGTSVHPAAGVFPRFHAPHCWTVARQTRQDAAAAAFPPPQSAPCTGWWWLLLAVPHPQARRLSSRLALISRMACG